MISAVFTGTCNGCQAEDVEIVEIGTPIGDTIGVCRSCLLEAAIRFENNTFMYGWSGKDENGKQEIGHVYPHLTGTKMCSPDFFRNDIKEGRGYIAKLLVFPVKDVSDGDD